MESTELFKIVTLPTEVLIKIFSHIQYRDNVTLTCHRFYEIICLMKTKGGEKIVIRDERMVKAL